LRGGRNREGLRRRRDEDDDQAHRLVDDDLLQGDEPEQPDQQRQPELRTAEIDEPAEQPDRGPTRKACPSGRRAERRWAS
jgi:hypothetical protein